jgi:DNA-binding phage protein
VGDTQQARKQQDRSLDLFRVGRANWGTARVHQEDPENATRRDRPGAKADEGDDEMSKIKKNPHWGSTLDEFLDEAGIRETAKAEAVTRVVAWQLSKEMKRQGMSKAQLAKLMNTSRAQVDRILNAKGNVTIETLQRAAALVGRQLRLELV